MYAIDPGFSPIGDESAFELANLSRLETLHICKANLNEDQDQIGNSGLYSLSRLSNLVELELRGITPSEAFNANIGRTQFNSVRQGISSIGLFYLPRLSKLQRLKLSMRVRYLGHKQMKDNDARVLARLENLTQLELCTTPKRLRIKQYRSWGILLSVPRSLQCDPSHDKYPTLLFRQKSNRKRRSTSVASSFQNSVP